jgi:ribonuclease-3
LANTFEALIGSAYLDSGYKTCNKFIKKYLIVKLEEIIKKGLYKDAKSCFQEQSQEKEGITPTYKVLRESGPDHAKRFVVGVFLEKELIAKGDGYSKQEAESEAAKNGLEAKKW